jgi:hypothetical protein
MLPARIGYCSENPDPFFIERDGGNVNISDKALKSVAFLGIMKDGQFHPRATAFFVEWTENQHRFDHLVTAEHVVSGLLSQNQDIWLRVNILGGGAGELKLDPQRFFYHPNNEQNPTDVAVCPISRLIIDESGKEAEADIVFMSLNGSGGFLPTDEFRQQYMGRGGNIHVIGLFRSHLGKKRNVPIVRVGTIAALPDEPIWTKYAGFIDAYLIEARSIAGLSGSPVFAVAEPAFELAKGLLKEKRLQGTALMGLIHGHFDVPNLNEDVVADEDVPARSVHTGIGVVIPVEKIIETIQHPDLIAMRKTIVEKLRESGATSDLLADDASKSSPSASDENPTHREDFTRLVGAAARKPERGD